MNKAELENLVGTLMESYEKYPETVNVDQTNRLNRELIVAILEQVRYVLFPGYFEKKQLTSVSLQFHIGELLEDINYNLSRQIVRALQHSVNESVAQMTYDELKAEAERISEEFIHRLPALRDVLATDIHAAYDGDPAAYNTDETIFSYPGVYAITVNRIAHELFVLGVPMIPRIMTEHAHSLTGIDIHPGATIGSYFFIDHGTGVVIGETTVIGRGAKIYQGVTLGGLSTRGGQSLRNSKRHPTLGDNVTVYSGASILGGETIIGDGAVIGSNAFITSSVPAGTRVTIRNPELQYKNREKKTKELGQEGFWKNHGEVSPDGDGS